MIQGTSCSFSISGGRPALRTTALFSSTLCWVVHVLLSCVCLADVTLVLGCVDLVRPLSSFEQLLQRHGTHLQKLSLRKTEMLNKHLQLIKLLCPCLRSLDVSYCPSLSLFKGFFVVLLCYSLSIVSILSLPFSLTISLPLLLLPLLPSSPLILLLFYCIVITTRNGDNCIGSQQLYICLLDLGSMCSFVILGAVYVEFGGLCMCVCVCVCVCECVVMCCNIWCAWMCALLFSKYVCWSCGMLIYLPC